MKCASLNACLLVAVAAPAIFCTAGCSRGSSSGAVASEIATLDQAYRAGVLTKAEYEAKKTGVESQAPALEALEQAVAAGVVSRGDYPAMKARLIAKGIGLAALEQGHKAGVFSDQEYATRKAALTATPVPSAPGAAATVAAVGSPSVTAVVASGTSTSATAPTAVGVPAAAPAAPHRPVPVATAAAPAAHSASRTDSNDCKGWKEQNNFLHNLGLCDDKNDDETRFRKENGNDVIESNNSVARMGEGSKYILPSWVPVYPGATTEGSEITKEDGHPYYTQELHSADPMKTVIDFYRTRMTGFKTTSSSTSSTSMDLWLENAQHKFQIDVSRFPNMSYTFMSIHAQEK